MIKITVTVYILENKNISLDITLHINKYDHIIYADNNSITDTIKGVKPLKVVIYIIGTQIGIIEKIYTEHNIINTYTDLAIYINNEYNLSKISIDSKSINTRIYHTITYLIENKYPYVLFSIH